MKELYLLNNGSKAGQYGIGTYITQLLSCLHACITIQVTVVVLDSQEDELTEKYTDGIRYLLFPTVRMHASEKNSKRYARLHYLPWCFDLAGNIYRFQSILATKEEKRDEFENQIYEEFQNNRRFYNEVDKVICLCHKTRTFLHKTCGVPIGRMELVHNGLYDSAKVLSDEERMKIKMEQTQWG